ncbi:MAG: hypothetical protein WCJ51_03175 [Candidatus Moraniibacteriota bacterium]
MNKNIKSEIYIAVLVLVAIIISGFFLLNSKKNIKLEEQVSIITKTDNSIEKQNQEIINSLNKKLAKYFGQSNINNEKISITDNMQNKFIIGRYSDDTYFFAAKEAGDWNIFDSGLIDYGYQVNCQDINKYNFPKEITPDCWDKDNLFLKPTPNPQRFSSKAISLEEMNDLTASFLNYSKDIKQSYGKYNPLHIYISTRLDNIILGNFKYKNGKETYVIEEFTLAIKISGKWKVIFQQKNWRDSNDFPSCDVIKKYNIPVKFFWPERETPC